MMVSKLEKVLVDIKRVIRESDTFHDAEVFFDESEMNPNVSLPAISFRVGNKTTITSQPMCSRYKRDLEIRLHTKTLDKRELQSELYEYEEELIHTINDAKLSGTIGDFYEITDTGSGKISALMFNARKEAGQMNETFFSNLLKVNFEVEYEI